MPQVSTLGDDIHQNRAINKYDLDGNQRAQNRLDRFHLEQVATS